VRSAWLRASSAARRARTSESRGVRVGRGEELHVAEEPIEETEVVGETVEECGGRAEVGDDAAEVDVAAEAGVEPTGDRVKASRAGIESVGIVVGRMASQCRAGGVV
jgi:hypothetical protein